MLIALIGKSDYTMRIKNFDIFLIPRHNVIIYCNFLSSHALYKTWLLQKVWKSILSLKCQIYLTVIQLQLLCIQNVIYWFTFCCSYVLMNIAANYHNTLLIHTYDVNISAELLFIIYKKHLLRNIQIMVVWIRNTFLLFILVSRLGTINLESNHRCNLRRKLLHDFRIKTHSKD